MDTHWFRYPLYLKKKMKTQSFRNFSVAQIHHCSKPGSILICWRGETRKSLQLHLHFSISHLVQCLYSFLHNSFNICPFFSLFFRSYSPSAIHTANYPWPHWILFHFWIWWTILNNPAVYLIFLPQSLKWPLIVLSIKMKWGTNNF